MARSSFRCRIVSPEVSAIAMQIAGKKFQPLLTHDLLFSLVQSLGAKVLRVEIVDLKESTFYARIYLEAAGQTIVVHARPSDSLAIALKAKAKIYVAPNRLLEIESLQNGEKGGRSGRPFRPTSAPGASGGRSKR